MNIKLLLFFIILLEGYVVLATELLAIRLIIPWVGSGTGIISIVVAGVLLPLAFGYYYGGKYKDKTHKIREKLLKNIRISLPILTIGLSYVALEVFFVGLYNLGFNNRIFLAIFYVLFFLVYPIFLLGQTVPLISNYFTKYKLSKITGKILMVSTLGSFLGSVFTAVILMSYIGVNYTVIFVISLLILILFLFSKIRNYTNFIFGVVCFILVFYLNSSWQMQAKNIVSNNAYNTVQVKTDKFNKDIRVMALNRGNSSSYKEGEGSTYEYVKYIDKIFIKPMRPPELPKQILIIGAAGFTMGLFDRYNWYSFVDIDPDLKKVAEKEFLKQSLPENKKFIPIPARAFLAKEIADNKTYDLVILDTFKAGALIPEPLLTKEYFEQVKKVTKDGGFVVINTVVTMDFTGKFSKRLDNTIRSVFPYVTRQIMWDKKNAKLLTKNKYNVHIANAIYSYYKEPDAKIDNTIYTDNKNPSFLDKRN